MTLTPKCLQGPLPALLVATLLAPTLPIATAQDVPADECGPPESQPPPPEPTTPPCPAPKILTITSQSSLPPTDGSNTNDREASITLTWEWTHQEPGMADWLDSMTLVRRPAPSSAAPDQSYVDSEYDEAGNPVLAGTLTVAQIRIRDASECDATPSGACGYQFTDQTIAGARWYEYQVLIKTKPTAEQAAKTVASNLARHREDQAPPWPVALLSVEIQPRALLPGPPSDADDAYYPQDLAQTSQSYGTAHIQWTAHDQGPAASTVHVTVHTPEGGQFTCQISPTIGGEAGLRFPQDFDGAPDCTATGPVPAVVEPDSGPYDVDVVLSNPDGRGLSVEARVDRSWSFPDPDGEQTVTHSHPDDADDPEPAIRRTTRLQRIDRVDHAGVRVQASIDPIAIPPPNPSRWTQLERDWQPATQLDVPGAPCAAPTLLQLFSKRRFDDRSLGLDTPLEPFDRSLDGAITRFVTIDQSFDTGDTPGGSETPPRFAQYARTHAPLEGTALTQWTNQWVSDGSTFSFPSWTALFVEPEPLPPDVVGPPAPASAPRLPFNGVGPHCWINHLIALATHPWLPTQPLATIVDLGSSRHEFHHDVSTQHEAQRRRLHHPGAQGILDHGGETCRCVYQDEDQTLAEHELRQSYETPYNRYVELWSLGTDAPLAGSAAFHYGSTAEPDLEAALGAAFGMFDPVIEAGTSHQLMTQIAARNAGQNALSTRWDHADVPPPPTVPLESTPAARNVIAPWVEIRPNLGLRDVEERWFVPGNAVPVAYVGGMETPFRAARERNQWSWTFQYEWARTFDGTAWTLFPGAQTPAGVAPYTVEDYERGGGTVTWRVHVEATLRTRSGSVVERVPLDAEASFRLDKWSLLDSDPAAIGAPVMKRDTSPFNQSLRRAWWYTFPNQAAPWETLAPDEDAPDLYGTEAGTSLTRGYGLLPETGSRLMAQNPDPIEGIVSPERYREREPDAPGATTWHWSQAEWDRWTPDQQHEWRIHSDSFLQFLFTHDADTPQDGDAVLSWNLWTTPEVADRVLGYLNPSSPGYAQGDQSYLVREGDVLHFDLRVSPTTKAGEVKTRDPLPAWDDSGWDDFQDDFGLGEEGYESWYRSLEKRTRVSVTAEYGPNQGPGDGAWQQVHTASLNQWAHHEVPLNSGATLTRLLLRAQPFVGDVPNQEAVHAVYLDNVYIHSPGHGREFEFFTHRNPVPPDLTLIEDNAWTQYTGERAYATTLHINQAYSVDDESEASAPDPTNPFLVLMDVASIRSQEAPSAHQQPLLVAGLQVGEPRPGYDRAANLGSARYRAEPQDLYFALADDAQAPTNSLTPPRLSYWLQYKVQAPLRFDDAESPAWAPRKELNGHDGNSDLTRNLRGLPHLPDAYASWDLLSPHPMDQALPDYLHYSPALDARPILNLDGTTTYAANVAFPLPDQPLMGAAPVTPFWSVPPVMVGQDNALTIDLNQGNLIDVAALRQDVKTRYISTRHAWVDIVPYPSRIDACYRWDPAQPWMNVQALGQDPDEPLEAGRLLHVRLQLVVWQDTPAQRDQLSQDSCAATHQHDAPNLGADRPETELQRLATLQVFVLENDPTDPQHPHLNHLEVSSGEMDASNGFYEFAFRITQTPSFTVVYDEPQFWARSSHLQVGATLLQESEAAGKDGRWSLLFSLGLILLVAAGANSLTRLLAGPKTGRP